MIPSFTTRAQNHESQSNRSEEHRPPPQNKKSKKRIKGSQKYEAMHTYLMMKTQMEKNRTT